MILVQSVRHFPLDWQDAGGRVLIVIMSLFAYHNYGPTYLLSQTILGENTRNVDEGCTGEILQGKIVLFCDWQYTV